MKVTKEMPVYGIVVDAFIKEIEHTENVRATFMSDYDGHLYIDDFYFGVGEGYLIVAQKDVYNNNNDVLGAVGALELILEDIDADEIAGAVKRRREAHDKKQADDEKAQIEAWNKIKRTKDEAFLNQVMEKFGVFAS